MWLINQLYIELGLKLFGKDMDGPKMAFSCQINASVKSRAVLGVAEKSIRRTVRIEFEPEHSGYQNQSQNGN